MSRPLALLILTAAAATPSLAAKPPAAVTVAQLSRLLWQLRGQRDGKVAKRLSALRLTQRVSASRLAQWDAEFPGKRTRQTLTELTDASAFLDLPASEIPDRAPPDTDSMRQILLRSIAYVNKTVRKLPDFYALRTTTSFEDSGASLQDRFLLCSLATHNPLCLSEERMDTQAAYGDRHIRPAGKFHAIVTYVDGKEMENGHRGASSSGLDPSHGLVTTGEFGPILSVALGDALQGKIFWSHWERGASGLLAVFRFSVPAAHSHYLVSLPSYLAGPVSDGGFKAILPAYHGEIAVNPESGAIYRVTLLANPAPSDPRVLTAMMVRYGSVTLGGKAYICPVQGVALSEMPLHFASAAPPGAGKADAQPGQGKAAARPELLATRLNHITFTRYHLFRAQVKILPDAGPISPAPAPR